MIIVSEKDERFYISASSIKHGGKGLFAARDIEEGDHLEVVGVVVDRGSPADICTAYADSYKFAADYMGSYTRHIVPMGYAAIVNHANEKSKQNVEIRHISKDGRTMCVYQFIKPVRRGEEILANYGEEWEEMLEWAKAANESLDEGEESEWRSFLKQGLYNLEKLRKA